MLKASSLMDDWKAIIFCTSGVLVGILIVSPERYLLMVSEHLAGGYCSI